MVDDDTPNTVDGGGALALNEEQPMEHGLSVHVPPTHDASVAGSKSGEDRDAGGSCGSGAN